MLAHKKKSPKRNQTRHTNYRLCARPIFQCCQSQISDFDGPGCSRDEDIVALEVSVYDGWRPGVQEGETFQNLLTPPLQDFGVHFAQTPQVPERKKKHVLAFRRTGAPHKPVAPGYDANGLYSLLIMRSQRFLRGTKRNT